MRNIIACLIHKIILLQVEKSKGKKIKTGVAGTSMYVEHDEIVNKIKEDRLFLKEKVLSNP